MSWNIKVPTCSNPRPLHACCAFQDVAGAWTCVLSGLSFTCVSAAWLSILCARSIVYTRSACVRPFRTACCQELCGVARAFPVQVNLVPSL